MAIQLAEKTVYNIEPSEDEPAYMLELLLDQIEEAPSEGKPFVTYNYRLCSVDEFTGAEFETLSGVMAVTVERCPPTFSEVMRYHSRAKA